MEIPIANIYYLLCYAWDVLEEKDALAEVGALDSTDLLGLFAQVLTTGTRRLLRRGLDRGYLPREGEIPGVRGKLLVTATLRGDLLRRARAACAWDELEYDTLPNRILKTTLLRLRDEATLESGVRADLRDLLRWLAPIEPLALRATHFRRVQLHRNNRIYAFLLHVCEFIYECWLPEERGDGRRFRDFVRERLAQLFEKFVFQFYQRELPGAAGWRVTRPTFRWDWINPNADATAFMPEMQTDVALARPGRAIILDTKFYANALRAGQYGGARLPAANFYQLFTYVRQHSAAAGWENAEGVLLYPQTTREFAAEFMTHGHRLRALTLDLAQPWQRIHDALLAIIDAPNLVGSNAAPLLQTPA